MRRALFKASPVLKVLFGLGIFAWMAASGKLNFAQIAKGLAHWPLMLAILGLGYSQIGLCVWRWTMLLHAQDIPLSFRRAWGLTMIGVLFNIVIPGAVSLRRRHDGGEGDCDRRRLRPARVQTDRRVDPQCAGPANQDRRAAQLSRAPRRHRAGEGAVVLALRYPPLVPAEAGTQNPYKVLDSRLRGNERMSDAPAYFFICLPRNSCVRLQASAAASLL